MLAVLFWHTPKMPLSNSISLFDSLQTNLSWRHFLEKAQKHKSETQSSYQTMACLKTNHLFDQRHFLLQTKDNGWFKNRQSKKKLNENKPTSFFYQFYFGMAFIYAMQIPISCYLFLFGFVFKQYLEWLSISNKIL